MEPFFAHLPSSVRDCLYWQYRRGVKASKPKRIVSLVFLTIDLDQKTFLDICHVIIEGSLPWAVLRKMTRKRASMYVSGKYIQLPSPGAENKLMLKLPDQDMHSHVRRERFYYCKADSTDDSIRIYS